MPTRAYSPISAPSATVALILLLLIDPAAAATTWHVRVDGGSASQCTGLANNAYPGSGSDQACAWSHPFVALPPGAPARIQGGDTLLIGPGDYMMGYGAVETGNCHQSWSWECHMARIPSGPSPDQPTRILGVGHDSGCSEAPELWGTERTWMVVNMESSSNVELACLEITDHSSCIESHCHNGLCSGEVAACNRDTPPFGEWASTGLSARDSSAVVLNDVHIHGLANRGVFAGRISDWTLQRTQITANGWIGWDGDIGADSSNSGTISFLESEIAYNGCAERWPGGEIFGCWAQGGGGYGDGLGVGASGGHWIFEDSNVHRNTSDGIDLLYLNDQGRVTIRRTLVDSNAGNQVKVSRSALIENSVVVGNCGYFSGEGNMHAGDHCRAAGDAVYVGLGNDAQTDLINNTIVGQGNCVISGGGGSTASRLLLANNLIIGNDYWHDPNHISCLYYSDSSEQIVWQNNFVSNVRHGDCPGNSLCSDSPRIADAGLASFDAEPLSDSELIDNADGSLAPPEDFHNLARSIGAGPDIGAIEWGTAADDPPNAPPSDPATAVFSYACTGLQCSFTSTSNDPAFNYAWDLGDGSSGAGASVDHVYGTDGSYTVTLTVIDDLGQSSSASQTVQVLGSCSGDAEILINAHGYRTNVRWTTNIIWLGAGSSNIDLYRDGVHVATIANSGSTVDTLRMRGGGSLDYKICEAGGSICSESLTVEF